MACRLFGAKPLPEPVLPHCQTGPLRKKASVKFENQNTPLFINENEFGNLVNCGYLVQGG